MKKLQVIETLADAERAMSRLQVCDANVKKMEAEHATKVAGMREAMVDQCAEDADEAKRLTNLLEEFATSNRKNTEIFIPGKKSLDLLSGTISFRTGALSISLKKGTKTEEVLDTAKKLKLDIIRIADPELDKSAVKDLIEEGTITDDVLKKLGLVATQSETCTVKINDL